MLRETLLGDEHVLFAVNLCLAYTRTHARTFVPGGCDDSSYADVKLGNHACTKVDVSVGRARSRGPRFRATRVGAALYSW
jgi:hypothetical protein